MTKLLTQKHECMCALRKDQTAHLLTIYIKMINVTSFIGCLEMDVL